MVQQRRRSAPYILMGVVTALVVLIYGLGYPKSGLSRQIAPDQPQAGASQEAQQLQADTEDTPAEQLVPAETCGDTSIVYPEWPAGFQPNISAAFIIGEQKSGTTWLWEMLNGHPCLLTAAQPHARLGAITTKETYYFTSTKISSDARQFLVPWLDLPSSSAASDEPWRSINSSWFEQAQAAADRGTASNARDFYAARTYVKPVKKLTMRPCEQYFLLEATPHNLHTPVAAARIRKLFPDAKAIAVLKEPVWRMRSAYNQFQTNFKRDCRAAAPKAWCPVHRYYQLQLPSFAEILRNELDYLKYTGCAFQSTSPLEQRRSWLDCFGCGVLEPWLHLTEGVFVTTPPFVPSAALSMYAQMLEEWLQWFPAEQMRAMNYQQLVDEPFEVVNRMLRFIGVEEYTQREWDILKPGKLGFRGKGVTGSDTETAAAEADMAEFFRPHNARLDALMQAQGWPWTPFSRD